MKCNSYPIRIHLCLPYYHFASDSVHNQSRTSIFPRQCSWLPWVLGGILALRATFRLDSPVKKPHASPFQTPSKSGHPSYPSSSWLRTTCHEIMSPESLKPFRIPKKNTRQCHETKESLSTH